MNKIVGLAFLSLFSLPASAGLTTAVPFEFDGSSLGGADVKNISLADFTYAGDVDFTGDAFHMHAVAFISSFRNDFNSPPIAGTGLGDKYNLYLTFDGQGTRSQIIPGVTKGSFSEMQVKMWADPDRNTGIGTVTPGAPDQQTSPSGNTSDDIELFTSKLVKGESFHIDSQSRGAFDLLQDVEKVDGSFLKGAFLTQKYPEIHLSGVNSFLGDIPAIGETKLDVNILGSGNVNVIPEPTVPAMLAFGVMALIAIRRLRS